MRSSRPEKIIMAAIGLATGFALSTSFTGSHSDVDESTKTRNGESKLGGLSTTSQNASGPKDSAATRHHKTATVLREHALKVHLGGTDYLADLRRMESTELRKLLVELTWEQTKGLPVFKRIQPSPKMILHIRSSRAIRGAAAELVRREGEASLKWAEGLKWDPESAPPETDASVARREILNEMVYAMLSVDPGLAEKWIEREDLRVDADNPILWQMGEMSLSRMAPMIKKYLYRGARYDGPLPANFDFPRFLNLFPEQGPSFVFEHWAASDPDAALPTWCELKASNPDLYPGDILKGIALAKGTVEATKWILSASERYPEAELSEGFSALWWNLDPESEEVSRAMSLLPSDELRVDLVKSFINQERMNKCDHLLNALGNPDLQVRAMEKALDDPVSYDGCLDDSTIRSYHKVMATLQLPPDARARIERKLEAASR